MRTFRVIFILLLIAALLVPALAVLPPASAQEGSSPYWPTNGWRTSTPEAQGIDSSALLATLPSALSFHSLLVIRHGYVVMDISTFPFKSTAPHMLASVTKSFVATLVGIAIDKGYIKAVKQSIWDFFPKEKTANMDEHKAAITVEDLLRHRSGLLFESSGDWFSYYPLTEKDQDWVQFILDRPMAGAPGVVFRYLDANATLLSAIIQKATGMTTLDFAKQNLFGPLGITDVTWLTTPQDVNIGGDELFLSAQDMAKLGYLYLHDGQWEGKPIVSAAWVKAATGDYLKADTYYGYLWWFAQFGNTGTGIYVALGWGGQSIWVFPSLDLIAVTTGYPGATDRMVLSDWASSLILPSVKSDRPLSENPDALAKINSQIQTFANPTPKTPRSVPDSVKAVVGKVYMLEDNELGWKSIGLDSITQDAKEAVVTLEVKERQLKLPVGLDYVYHISTAGLPAQPNAPRYKLADNIPLASKGICTSQGLTFIMLDVQGNESWTIALVFKKNNELTVDAQLMGMQEVFITGKAP